MNKYIKFSVLFLLNFLLSSCKKDTIPIKDNVNIEDLYNLSNYKITMKSINDTIVECKGFNNIFTIEGRYNQLYKHKIGWWSVSKNNELYSRVQFLMIGAKEHMNQVLVFKNNKVDTSASKLYTVRFISQNNRIQKAVYNIYTPKSTFINKNVNFMYSIFNEKEISSEKLSLPIDSNHFSKEIDLSKYSALKKSVIAGLFVEYSYERNKRQMGINEIFIKDSIK